MAKSVIFKVINNRLLFRCSACKAKRNVTIPPDIRVKSIRCHKCSELTRCVFNRRVEARESQAGIVVLTTSSGREIDVMLSDRSGQGFGFSIPVGTARSYKIGVGNQVRLHCNWNPRLIPATTYIVQNVNGQRVGIKTRTVSLL